MPYALGVNRLFLMSNHLTKTKRKYYERNKHYCHTSRLNSLCLCRRAEATSDSNPGRPASVPSHRHRSRCRPQVRKTQLAQAEVIFGEW